MPSRLIAAALLALGTMPSAQAGTISGRVVGPDGNPVADARVLWLPDRSPVQAAADATAGVPPKALGETRTDAQGRFQAALDPAAGRVRLRVEPAALPWAALDGPFDPSESVRLPDLELPQAAAISGVVAGPDGKPIAGAHVDARAAGPDRDAAFFAEAAAGSDGAFRIANAPAGALIVRIRAGGWAPASRLLRVSPGALRLSLTRGGAIAGTVRDADGHPVPGAFVRSLDLAVASDANGHYRLDGVAAGLQRVEALAPGNLVARKGGLRVAAGAETTADLTLGRGAEIAGTVTDSLTRRPIAGARVSLSEHFGSGIEALEPASVVRTDSHGRFSAAGLLPGDFQVRAEKPGYLPAELPKVGATSAAPAAAPLVLTPAASITGRVVDAQGKAVPGATVSLEPPRGGRGRFGAGIAAMLRGPRAGATTRSGPDGSFRLDGLAAVSNGAPLIATHAGFAQAERPGVTLQTGQALAGVVLTLTPGLAVKGRVVDEASQPVAGAEIRVAVSEGRGGGRRLARAFGGAAPSAPNAVSSADGTFTVSGLVAGPYDVTASHDGFSPKTATALPAPAKQSSGWPPLVLARGAAVSGVVHDDQGAPIVGAAVSVLGEGLDPRQTTSDGSGAFRLEDLAKGRSLMLAANAPGFAFSSRSITPPADGVTIVLGKSATIRGRVVDAATGTPVTAFMVGASPAARGRGPGGGGFRGGPSEAQYADDGTFEISVAPGTWDIRATADGYRPADVSNVELEAGAEKEGVELSLKRGGGLAGHVVDLHGNPVAGANVACCDAGARSGGPGGGGSGPSATSDGDGHFQLDGLPDGHVTLTVTDGDFVPATRDVDPASTSDVVLTLSTGGEISGNVVSGDGSSPVAGASVRLDPEGDSGTAVGASQTAQSDGSGAFHFDHLTAGRYRLTAQTQSASSTPQDLVLADGQPMDGVRVTVASGAEVDGIVSGLPSGQLGGVNVSASATGFQASVVTSDDGHFTLTSVPPGVVRISGATAMPSVRTVAKTVEVSADDTQVSVELAFEGGSRLSGAVTRAGQPVTQFTVNATPDPPDGSGRRYTAMSDGSGRYAIEDMTDGNYQVLVNGTASPYRTTIAVSGDTNGDIALPASALSGIVTDTASGQPLEGAAVSAQTGVESTSQGIQRTTTDSSGSYTISGLDPGDYQVSARKDGYQLKTQTITVGADAASLDFALDGGLGLTIQANDGLTGMPLGGVTALAFGAGGAIAYQGTVALDATGTGQIPSLPAGQYAIYLFSSGYAPQALPNATVPSAPQRVAFTPGGSVQARASAPLLGRIVDASGSPVLLSPFRLDGSVTVAPPVSVWQHLPPGSYSFLVPSGNSSASYPFAVAEGQTTQLALP